MKKDCEEMVSHFLAVFLIPYHSDAWSRSQPPAVQAGQIQYFTPLSFASWAAFARFLAVSAPKMQRPLLIQRKESHGRWSSHLPSVPSSAEQRLSLHPLFRRHPGMTGIPFQPAVAAGRIHDFFDLFYDFFFCHKNHPFCSNII